MITTPKEMNTVTEVLEKLRVKRFDNEFKLSGDNFTTGNGKMYTPGDLKIIRTYRFEGDSNPADSSIIYIIEANDGLTGYSLDSYGMYSDHEEEGYDEFIRKIPVEGRDEQVIF